MARSSALRRMVLLSGRLLSLFAILILLAYAGPVLAIGPAKPLPQEVAAVITSPQSGSSVRGSVQITGSALHPAFQRYELYFTVEPGENWVFIGEARTNPVSNGVLGSWETGGLPDGNYSLRLRVVRQDGNYDEGFARNIVVANTTPPTPTPTDTPAFDEQATLPPPIESVVTPTPAATPTPAVVEQPEIPTPTPRPSPSPTITPDQTGQAVAADSGTPSESSGGPSLTDALETSTLQSSFVRGASLTAAIFLAVGAFFGVRRLLTWLWYLIAP
jgi:hypothetical protein